MNRLDRFCTRTLPLLLIVAAVIADGRLNAIADGRITHAGQAGTVNGTPPRESTSLPLGAATAVLPGTSRGAGCHPSLTPAATTPQTPAAAGPSVRTAPRGSDAHRGAWLDCIADAPATRRSLPGRSTIDPVGH